MDLSTIQEPKLFRGDVTGKERLYPRSYDFSNYFVKTSTERDGLEVSKGVRLIIFWDQGEEGGVERGANGSRDSGFFYYSYQVIT